MSYFVDTNILVYARDATEPEKQERSHLWLSHLWRNRSGRISYQVLQEYYVIVTCKLDPGLRVTEARDDIRDFLAWNPISIERNVIEAAWSVQDRFKFSWWDALIIAAAQVLDCDYLLSEDMQHKQVVDGLTILNPFLEELQ